MSTRDAAASGRYAGVIIAVMALPFLAGGVVLGVVSARDWGLYLRSRAWTSVPATVETVTLERKHTPKGAIFHELRCRYTYRFPPPDGPLRSGTRVAVPAERAIDSHRGDWYETLARAQRDGAAVTALVDPANPDDAVLFRARTSAMIILPLMALVIGGAGAGLIATSVAVSRAQRSRARRLRLDPSRPWRADRRWATHGLTPAETPAAPATVWAIAAFVNLLLAAFWVGIAEGTRATPWWTLVFLAVFQAFGAALVGAAIRASLHRRKYGRIRMWLRAIPVLPGGVVEGTVEIAAPVDASTATVSLTCVRRVRRSRTADRITSLHQASTTAPIEVGMSADGKLARVTRIPVRVDVPTGLPPTSDASVSREGPPGEIVWAVQVAATTPGIDLGATFELPVFDVAPALVERA